MFQCLLLVRRNDTELTCHCKECDIYPTMQSILNLSIDIIFLPFVHLKSLNLLLQHTIRSSSSPAFQILIEEFNRTLHRQVEIIGNIMVVPRILVILNRHRVSICQDLLVQVL
jgi:hypothetical protein